MMLIVRAGLQTVRGMLATDECFHAYLAEWIAAHHRLPDVLPEFYSGFFYYYQPLFHVLGALWIGAFGRDAILGLPVALGALLFLTLVSGVLGAVPRAAGRWTALLLLVHPSLASMAVRVYVESLVTWAFVLAIGLLFLARRSPRAWPAIALGAVLGLALLAKFNAWVLWLGVAAIAAWDAFHGRRAAALRLGLACAIGALMVAPWLLRNQALFGSAFYPAFAPDLDHHLYALNVGKFATPPREFLAAIPAVLGPWPLLLAAVALVGAAVRRRWTLTESVLVAAAGAMVVTAFVPLSAARHLNPFIALFTLMAAAGVADWIADRPAARLATEVAILGLAVYGLLTLPDYRRAADPPEFLVEAMPAIAERTPPDARILSLWTYDTFYYTRRAATWPNPWGQRERPLAMFYDTDPDSILRHLRESHVTHVLVPNFPDPTPFNSANYPMNFRNGLASLGRRGAIRLVWNSAAVSLIEIPRDAPAPAR